MMFSLVKKLEATARGFVVWCWNFLATNYESGVRCCDKRKRNKMFYQKLRPQPAENQICPIYRTVSQAPETMRIYQEWQSRFLGDLPDRPMQLVYYSSRRFSREERVRIGNSSLRQEMVGLLHMTRHFLPAMPANVPVVPSEDQVCPIAPIFRTSQGREILALHMRGVSASCPPGHLRLSHEVHEALVAARAFRARASPVVRERLQCERLELEREGLIAPHDDMWPLCDSGSSVSIFTANAGRLPRLYSRQALMQ